MLKAIETLYNGYRFRSRVEARWAVFFDRLEIAYEYEKEGFELDCGRYLPDFWLPAHEAWIEIKGQSPTDEEIVKVCALAVGTERMVVLFAGELSFANKGHFAHPYTGEFVPSCFCWAECGGCRGISLVLDEALPQIRCAPCGGFTPHLALSKRIRDAFTSARSARFEFKDAA